MSENVVEKKIIRIRPQEGFQERFMSSNADITIGGGAAGVGKQQPNTEPVMTPNGWKLMGEIKPNSLVMCPITGHPIRVLQTFPHKNLNIYKVSFNDGTSTECCEDHLWRIQTRKQIERNNYQVIDVNKMLEMGVKCNNGDNRFSIDCNVPLNFNESKVDLDPYLLGLLLGDGHMSSKSMVSMQVALDESESLFNYIHKHIPSDVTIRLRKQYATNCRQITFTHQIKKYLKELGLLDKKSQYKFVPKNYLYNSIHIRKEVLAGLLDTDSYIESFPTKKKTNYFTTSVQLKDDFCELIRSLGGVASVRTDGRDKYKSGVCYIVAYRLPFNPFKRDRRKILFDQVGYKFHFKKKITAIDYVGKKDGQCILVDSPYHLYITNGYNATHNTAVLSLEPLYDVSNPDFLAVFFRRKATELGPVLKECHKWYTKVRPTPSFTGKANSSEWKFPSGALVEFAHLQYDKDVENHQGKEYSLICFDELTHFSFYQFNYLLTRNRSTSGAKSRVKATCNPDPDSWVAKLIDWWIGDDGFPIKERWGKIRYFLVNGEDISDYIWGNTPDEVKEKAGDLLKKAVAEADSEYVTEDHFITSLTFIGGKLNENKELLKKDPTYFSKLYNQGEAVRKTLLEGNWKFRSKGKELVSHDTMDAMFERYPQRNGRRCISTDVAAKGSDMMVVKCYDGFHLIDFNVIPRSNGKQIVDAILGMMRKWHVGARDVVFDANGVGSHIDGYIPNAIEYRSQAQPLNEEFYFNLKAQCSQRWADRMNGTLIGEDANSKLNYSIDRSLVDRVINGKTLYEIYQEERKAIILDPISVDGKPRMIKKSEMIALIGHSPDYIETDIMLELLYLQNTTSKINLIW